MTTFTQLSHMQCTWTYSICILSLYLDRASTLNVIIIVQENALHCISSLAVPCFPPIKRRRRSSSIYVHYARPDNRCCLLLERWGDVQGGTIRTDLIHMNSLASSRGAWLGDSCHKHTFLGESAMWNFHTHTHTQQIKCHPAVIVSAVTQSECVSCVSFCNCLPEEKCIFMRSASGRFVMFVRCWMINTCGSDDCLHFVCEWYEPQPANMTHIHSPTLEWGQLYLKKSSYISNCYKKKIRRNV